MVRANRHSPIVVLTGTDDDAVATEALRAGAQDYLVKGTIDPEALLRAIRYANERHALKAELRREATEAAAQAAAMRMLVEVMEDGIVVVDESGKIKFANAAVVELFGSRRGAERALGKLRAESTLRITHADGCQRHVEVRWTFGRWDKRPCRIAVVREVLQGRHSEPTMPMLEQGPLGGESESVRTWSHTGWSDWARSARLANAGAEYAP